MSLLTLSVDALGLIFKWLDITSLIKLYLVGNRMLHYRSVVGKAVRDLRMEVSQYKQSYEARAQPKRFSRLKAISQISALSIYPSIEFLTLDFSGHSATLDAVEAILSLDLRVLTIIAPNAWSLFVEPNGQVRSLQASFRRLTSLVLEDMKPIDTRISTDSVMEQIGKQLPQSLTRLHLSTFARPPQPLLDRLPPQIVDLLLATSSGQTITRFAVGSDLTKVTFVQQTTVEVETLQNLPKTLAALSIRPTTRHATPISGMPAVLPARLVVHLPSTLTSLVVPTHTLWTPEVATLLPRSLTLLDARRWYNLDDDALSKLPEKLTSLYISGNSDNVSDKGYSLLPKRLTNLWCRIRIREPSALASLPPGLTRFYHSGSAEYTPPTNPPAPPLYNIETFIPPKITKLNFGAQRVTFANLPPTLHTFSFQHCPEPMELKNLPSSLQKLTLGQLVDNKSDDEANCALPPDWKLPPTLTKLIALHPRPPFDDRIMALIPPTLTKLHVNEASSITTRGLLHLPPTLKYCFIDCIELNEHTASFIPSLESYQKHRSFNLDQLADLAISLLPRSVTTKAFECFVTKLTPSLVASFPRDLLSFTLQVTSTTDLGRWDELRAQKTNNQECVVRAKMPSSEAATFAALPPTLTRFHLRPFYTGIIGNCMVSRDTFEHLPSTLTDLDIRVPFTDISLSVLGICPPVLYCAKLETLPTFVKELRLPMIPLDEKQFQTLPRSLTVLQVQRCNYTLHPIASLVGPYDVRASSSSSAVAKGLMAPFERLPPRLTKLELTAEFVELAGACTVLLRSTVPFVPLTSFGVSKKSEKRLFVEDWELYTQAKSSEKTPPEVTDISIRDDSLGDDFFRRLSPSVTRIALLGSSNITTMSMSHWPESLTRIELNALQFGARDLKDAPLLADLKVFNWAFLHSLLKSKAPKGLVDFIVEQQGTSTTADWLNVLPKTLQTIDLPGHSSLQDIAVKNLPSGLLALILPANHRLTSACIPSLPRTLTTLVLPNLPITDKFAVQLPAGLTHLDLSSVNVPPTCIPLLPRALTHLNLANTCVPDACLATLPAQLKFLRFKQILLTGSLAASFAEDSEMSLLSLIVAAEACFPNTLESQPCLEWRLETPLSFVLEKIRATPATSINFPGDHVGTFTSLTKPKPGVFYRVLASNGTSIPPTLLTGRTIGGTITYKLVDPNPPSYLTSSSSSEKLQLFSVFWMLSRDEITEPILGSSQKVKSLRFQNLHALLPSALRGLPNTLTSLRLPHSRRLDLYSLGALPDSITDLQVDTEDHSAVRALILEIQAQVPHRRDHLPPNLTRLALGAKVFVGQNTADLHVPPLPEDDAESPPDDIDF